MKDDISSDLRLIIINFLKLATFITHRGLHNFAPLKIESNQQKCYKIFQVVEAKFKSMTYCVY